MNALTTKKALLAAAAGSVLFGAQSASGALITNWDYTVTSGFSNFTASQEGGPGPLTQGSEGGRDILSWGAPANDDNEQSSISVDAQVTNPPPLVTNDPTGVPGANFIHNNRIISDDSEMLDTFDLTTQLDLTAAAPPEEAGQSQSLAPITFNSFFTETDNIDGSGDDDTCLPTSVSECDDIFVLSNADELDALGGGQSFTIGDFQYTVFLDIAGLEDPLTDAQCAAADAGSGCVGFTTQESQENEFTTNFRIEAEQVAVPEPGTLALLGVGLAGLGFATRARKS